MRDMTTTPDPPKLNLATCSFKAFDPSMGVPVRTSVGAARFFRHKPEYVAALAPHGIFKAAAFEHATMDEKRAAYLDRLTEHMQELVTQLTALQRAHPDERLVLLCFENVHAGEICHRRWAAEWFAQRFGLDVPEISPPDGGGTSRRTGRQPSGGGRLFDPSKGNPFEDRARRAKAERILGQLLAEHRHVNVSAVEAMRPNDWNALAERAGANKPSPKTRALVVTMLKEEVAA